MNQHQKVGLAVVAAGILVAAVILSALRNDEVDDSAIVRIGYLNISASLPLFIAEDKGFFYTEGIRVETHQVATSNQLVDGVMAGNLDAFVEASAVPVLAAELQSPGRLRVFAVSSITKSAPFDALLVKKDSAVKSLTDLAGRRVGVFPGSTATNLLRKFLADQGVDVSNTTFVPVPPQSHLTALLEGSVDAIHAYEPTTAIALYHGGVRKLYGSAYAEMLDQNPQGVAVIATRFLEAEPEVARGVIRALERAMVFMRKNDAEARQILSNRMNLEVPIAERSVFLYMLPHLELDSSILQDYADLLFQLGELKGRVDVTGLLYHE